MNIEKIYFDMDGVLADFERGVRELCGMEPPPQEGEKEPGLDLSMWDRVRNVGNFYDVLELMPGAKEMFDAVYEKYGDKVEILTGIPKPDKHILTAAEDKISWMRRLISDKVVMNIVFRAEKPNFCKGKGHILIDDLGKNIREWENMGGTGILHISPEDTLRRLSEIEGDLANNNEVIEKLKRGNDLYLESLHNGGDVSPELRRKTAEEGQHPYAIVIACADSRVIPEAIFSADIGDLFVIRVAGNVLDNHQLGSIEYAAAHLDANVIVMLGHTRCGAVSATIKGSTEGYIRYITDDIREAIGGEKDDYKATVLNVKHGVNVIRQAFREHPEIPSDGLEIVGAVYNVDTGKVDWL